MVVLVPTPTPTRALLSPMGVLTPTPAPALTRPSWFTPTPTPTGPTPVPTPRFTPPEPTPTPTENGPMGMPMPIDAQPPSSAAEASTTAEVPRLKNGYRFGRVFMGQASEFTSKPHFDSARGWAFPRSRPVLEGQKKKTPVLRTAPGFRWSA